MHKLSPAKRNKKNTMDYFTLVLQTEDENINALLYSRNKRQLLSDSEQSHTPVKIQKFTKTETGDKIIINDMTKLCTPDQTEYGFQFENIVNPGDQIISIEEIVNNREPSDSVALRGKASYVCETSIVGPRHLKLAEAIFADKTGKITVDLWENRICLIQAGQMFTITELQVREWSGEKKVSTTPQSVIRSITDQALEKINVLEKDIETIAEQTINIPSIDVVKSVKTYIFCSNCSKKTLQATANNIVRCDICGSRMRLVSCKRELSVKVVVLRPIDGDAIELSIAKDTLKSIISLSLQTLNEDELAESLLALENLQIKYDPTKMIITKFL